MEVEKKTEIINVKPPVTKTPDFVTLTEFSDSESELDSHREVPCNVCNTSSVNSAPMIQCTILNKVQKICLDTAAVITVIPRTRDLPVAKLKLKGVTSHKANLYGPAMTTFEIEGQKFEHMTYEADIKEHIIGIDFLHKFDAVIKIKMQVAEIGEGHNRITIPFTLEESKFAKLYTTGRVVYRIRAESNFTLKPFTEKEITTQLKADSITDESVRERTDDCPGSGQTQDYSRGERSHSQSRVVLETKVVNQEVLTDSGSSRAQEAKGSQNNSRSQLSGETKLGVFVSNQAFGNKVSKLPTGVVVQSGIVPCVSAPITVTMQNFGDKCVNIPKYAVLGEVFILHPDEYEKEFIGITEEEEEGEESDGEEDTEDSAQVNVVHHETTPFVDAEYNTTPSMPEIKESEPLPKDLQALVDKCTELS